MAVTHTYDDEVVRLADARELYNDLRGRTDHLSEQKADNILKTISTPAAVQSFNDGADNLPVKQMQIAIEPVQAGSGDPSPTNVRAISGWTGCNVVRTGKNILDFSQNTNNLFYEDDGTTTNNNWVKCTTYTKVKPLTTYTVHGTNMHVSQGSSEVGIRFVEFDSNKTFISRSDSTLSGNVKSITTGANTAYVRITMGKSASNVQLEEGSTATAYEAFGTIYPIAFPSGAGTVYGGELTINEDGTGTLVVDTVKYSVPTNANWYNTYTGSVSRVWSVARNTYFPKVPVGLANNGKVLCNTLRPIAVINRDTSNYTYNVISVYNPSTNEIRVALPLEIDTKALVNQWISEHDVHVAYQVTEPDTYILTAPQVKTLLGLNNIWADTGNVNSITYRTDENINYEVDRVETRVEATQAMIAPAETLTAASNHAIRDIFVCGDQLLRATAAITTGETINTGTGGNAEVVTVVGLFTELLGQLTTLSGAVNAQASDLVDLNDYVHLMHEGVVYGFRIDSSVADPSNCVTYLADAKGLTPAHMDYTQNTFDYGSWENAFFMPRPCMLKYDGTVDYYLDSDDYTKKADGTASDVANTSYGGNAMMEWGRNGKKIWYAIVPDSNDNTCANIYIADHQVDDRFHAWSFINGDNQYVDHFYTPCYFGTLVNGTLRSLSGQSGANRCMNLTASGERTAAKANNPSGVDIWDTEVYADIVLINLLLILVGKSLSTQGVYGTGIVSSGTSTIDNNYTTGQHDTKGLFYGTSSGSAATYANAVKVFGMENWWGYKWRRYLGHVSVDLVTKYKMTRGTADGSTATDYVVSDIASDYSGYLTGATLPLAPDGGYIDKMTFDESQMAPKSLNGSNTTYYGDKCYTNTGTRLAYRGCSSNDGAIGGAFCDIFTDVYSRTVTWIGAALSCKPLAPTT